MHRQNWCVRLGFALAALLVVSAPLVAQITPQKAPAVADKAFQHPDLEIQAFNDEVGQLPSQAAAEARNRLAQLDVVEFSARVDRRSGRFVTLMPTTPIIPGRGVGNTLSWGTQGIPQTVDAIEEAAFAAFHDYLVSNQVDLGVATSELGAHRIAAHDFGDLVQIWIPRQFDGVPVRNSYISAVIGQGNLTLMSAHQWGDRPLRVDRGQITADRARQIVEEYWSPIKISGEWGDGDAELLWVPMARGQAPSDVALGRGYTYRLTWSVKVTVEGDLGQWEVLVDASTGAVLESVDRNHYAEVKGGVYPVTNDGVVPDGVEQAGWPMPFINVSTSGGTVTADTGGNLSASGSLTASLTGQYVRMSDNCGSSSLTQTDNLDFGTSGGDDCTTPGFGGAGNTHASRSGFYELNRTKEWARGWLPSNGWLTNQLTSVMNINQSCNAFWNGSTVNFYRSGGTCANTGEIAGVFVHEWGHGMDDFDVNGSIASPSGEGIADVYTALRLNDSCIGRNFQPGIQCGGNGDPCTDCTGVRDIDYLKKQSGQPHDFSWRNSTCGSSVHCIGHVYSEAVWSLWKRKLQSAPYNLDNNTAHEIVNRLTFIGAGNVGTWFSGSPPNGGCGGSSGYNNYLAADDDNGNLNDGTPHMGAIFAAFDDQEIACGSPTVQDSGCAGTPTAAPNVTATPGNNQVALSWNAISGASNYEIFRAEGIFQCDFGKVKVGEVTGTSFTDTGLQNGRDYSYVVIPKGSNDACFGNASACDTVQPAAGPECVVDADCNDGLFCNGVETCNAGSCVAGSDPCPGQGCDEVNDVCTAGGPCTHAADFTSGAGGWTAGSNTCTTGSFVVGSPDSTTWQVGGGNPGNAYYTQPNSGGLGTDDVDGGTCEALSPVIDCAGNSAADISLDYFHGQRDAGDDSNDGFTIEVLNDGVVVDTMVSIGDVTNNPAWTTVSTTVNNPGDIQIRVRATDAAGPGDIVEGGIDNVSVSPVAPQCSVNADCDDGLFCNGAETCNAGSCQAGSDPCPGQSCDEVADVCVAGGCVVDDDFESGTAGWNNDPASTCSTGAYVEGNPTQVTNSGVVTQVGGSNSGTTSIFTATNSSAGVNDVDGGNCILSSPSWSVPNASTLSVAYWHGQRDAGDDASGDFFLLEYSTNGGSTWNTLASNGDSTSNAAWTTATAGIPAGSTVELRVQCSDGAGPGDLVECGIDDVSICN